MKRIKHYFKKRKLKKELKNWEWQKNTLLSLVKDGTWEINNKFFLKLFRHAKAQVAFYKEQLEKHELSR